jgi:ADP-heptose:LPS heptosyltransferase
MVPRKLIAAARAVALLCIDTWVVRTVQPKPNSGKSLIVRLDAIGDFVLWISAAEALVNHFKAAGSRTVLVANEVWADWARRMALFDEVIPVNIGRFQNNLRYRYRLARQIRAEGYTSVVQPTYSRVWWAGDSIVRISGAPERIGSAGQLQTWRTRIANRWFTRLVAAEPATRMELIRGAEFLRNFGEPAFRAAMPRFKPGAFAPEQDFHSASNGQPYYVLFPGASWSGRRWPLANFRQIAERLWKQTGWLGIVAGSPSDSAFASELCTGTRVPLLDWTGHTDLPQLATLISKAKLLVSNETSATHIAAAANLPSVCILGGGHYGRFLPYQTEEALPVCAPRVATYRMPCFGCDWNCVYRPAEGVPAPCIGNITVESVWSEIESILASIQEPA